MIIELINEPNPQLSPKKQILINRGVPAENLDLYIDAVEDHLVCLPSYNLLGENLLKEAWKIILTAINTNKTIVVIVDCDCDGYTSAALLINYLYEHFPSWIPANLKCIMHDGKQHGLKDCMDNILSQENIGVVLVPDGGTNDYTEHKILREHGIDTIVIDHHLAETVSRDAIIINNQLSAYPNKELSGVGIVWQFCRYFDSLANTNYADRYLDLVALGNCADMVSLLSIESRGLISMGFQKENINNPFIDYIIDKNNYTLTKSDYKSDLKDQACTSMGAAFAIAPFVNAVTRSGTMQEKELLFQSMLEFMAFEKVDEIKYNKATGRQEYLVTKVMRMVQNIKSRQDKLVESSMKSLEQMIQDKELYNNAAIVLLLESNSTIPAAIRGLIANKIANKYQKPTIICAKDPTDGNYKGSTRGYTKNGIDNFKQILDTLDDVLMCEGHANANGVTIRGDISFEAFNKALAEAIQKAYQNITEACYQIDYLFTELNDTTLSTIKEIAKMNDYWGKDVERSYVGIRFTITPDNFAVLKSNTLKFQVGEHLSILKYGGTEEEIEAFSVTHPVEVTACCTCNINEWNGYEYPQLFLVDYNISKKAEFIF